MTKRAILYARVSGDDRANATSSIDSQLEECRRYCEQRGYSIVSEVFEDPRRQTSGADWLPELERVLLLAQSRTFDVLVCREVDRLARNRFKQLATEIELENHGVLVEYVVGQFENSDEGRLLKGLVSEFAEYERGKIRRRTYNGRLRAVKEGNTLIGGGSAPYGYDQVTLGGKRTLVINAGEADVIRLIFDLYGTKFYSLYEVGRYLDAHKVPLPAKNNGARKQSRGLGWNVGSLSDLLSQEIYIGRWHYRKTRKVKDTKTGKTRTMPRPREEWLEIAVPAIVSEELFVAVQERKKANKVQRGHQRKYFYTLGGMLECGHCHNGMTGMTKTERDREFSYYRCNRHSNRSRYSHDCDNTFYKVPLVEAAVWGWVKSILMEPDVLRRSIEEYQQAQRERVRPQLAMLESSQLRKVELETRNARLIEAYTKGVVSLDELAQQKAILDKEISQLGQALSILRAEVEPILLSPEHVESIQAVAAQIRDGVAFVDDDRQAQRAIFQLLDVHVALSHEGTQRWADVSCTLGTSHCAVDISTIDGGQHNRPSRRGAGQYKYGHNR